MIELTQPENQLFKVLLAAVDVGKLKVTLRVAGGWVRDKILKRPSSHDIDIALDTMTGIQFVEILHSYLKEEGVPVRGFGVIPKNPEKSKHLETATLQIFDFWIDFVNLRDESLEFGSPKDDAHLRDFTVNSLFFNINESKIEDFTESGMSDIESGLIRTPLDPLKSLGDDPLRVIRGFRFAARFGYAIEEGTLKAMKDPKIQETFATKISKERIGSEFLSNFSNVSHSKDPFRFLQLIQETEYWSILLGSNDAKWVDGGFVNMRRVWDLIDLLKEDIQYITKNEEGTDPAKQLSEEEFVMFILLAVFTLESFDPKIKDERKQFVYQFITNGLKLAHKYAQFAANLHVNFHELKRIAENQGPIDSLKALGFWQRSAEAMWPLVESLLNIILYNYDFAGNKILDLKQFFSQQGVADFYKFKPLLNGLEIKELFGAKKEEIRVRQTEVLTWQLHNPLGTKDEYLKEYRAS